MILLVRRIVAMWLVLVASVPLIAACGKSGSASLGGASTITKGHAAAFADAVNLREADVPMTKPEGSEIDVAYPRGENGDQVSICAGALGAREAVAEAPSPAVTRSGWLVRSVVRVVPSEALALADVSALATPRGRACLASSGARVVSTTWLPVAVPRGHRAVGVRTVVEAPNGPPNPRFWFYLDAFAFVVGPAEITLGTFSGEKPPPAAVERQLLSLLYSRAEAHKL